jgi:hypothetical protein
MNRGIYIVANNRVMENAIALLNSIRHYNSEVPIFLIPFNEDYQEVAETLGKFHGVQVFPDLNFLEQLTQKIGEIFDRDFLKLPNKMRKLAVWFGPLDEFLYIDTDIIVFEDIVANLDYLKQWDFFCCDYHFVGEKISNIFSPLVKEQGIFSDEQIEDVFNSGFWASRTGIFTLEQLYDILRDCSQHREYFDFSQGVTDQPILNYLVLKQISKRGNLVKPPENAPGSWGGSKHFKEKDHILYDNGKRLKYLHWAGTPLKPGGSYWNIWEYYRYLHEGKPTWKRKLTRLFPFLSSSSNF